MADQLELSVHVVAAQRLAADAAAHVADAAAAAVDTRDRFVVAFSGGSTPGGMLAELAGMDLPWSRVHVLQVDERVAPDGHPDRNVELLREHLTEGPLPAANLHAMPVAGDLAAAARDYAATVRELAGDPPVLDLVHLGLGTDGHTASLFPGEETLTATTRPVAVAGPYEGRRRLTLTLPVLNGARRRLWLVSGSDKAPMVSRLVTGDPSVPAGRVRRDRSLLLADDAAAAQLADA